MRRLGTIDLEILDLAMSVNGTFNENNLENSELKRLGVGKILDSLASLKDRKFISLNDNGSFSITDIAREILWSNIPTWAKILRLLQIKSCSLKQIIEILRISESGTDTTDIYHAEVALFISSIQLGVHGFWAVPWFYWEQAFWSILVMTVATLVGIGAYIPMVMVDPITSGITYGIYLLAHIIFVIGNTYLLVATYDKRKDRIKNPFSLYLNQQFNPKYTREAKSKKAGNSQ